MLGGGSAMRMAPSVVFLIMIPPVHWCAHLHALMRHSSERRWSALPEVACICDEIITKSNHFNTLGGTGGAAGAGVQPDQGKRFFHYRWNWRRPEGVVGP
jgi:hypothetical protein